MGGGISIYHITGLKKSFSIASYITVLIKILFEFDRFFKHQNVVKSRIHFKDKRGLYLGGRGGGGGGLITRCIFCLQVEGPINGRGIVIGSLRYERLSLNVSCITAVFMGSKLHLIVV